MAKWTIGTFIEKGKEKHGDKFDYSVTKYEGQEKELTFICPVHGEVTQKAKSHFVRSGCHICDEEKAKSKRKGAYSKRKGNNYELKVIKELIELGYPGLKSARSESKNLDNDKIDIAETDAQLPMYVQCKCTRNTPQISQIMEDCPRKDRPLAIFWNKQVDNGATMGTAGEFVIVPKDFFYKLIKK